MGINTDLNFIEGYLNSVKKKGPKEFYLRECACPSDVGSQWMDRYGSKEIILI